MPSSFWNQPSKTGTTGRPESRSIIGDQCDTSTGSPLQARSPVPLERIR